MRIEDEEYITELQIAILQKKDLGDLGFEIIKVKHKDIGALLINKHTNTAIFTGNREIFKLNYELKSQIISTEHASGGQVSIVILK